MMYVWAIPFLMISILIILLIIDERQLVADHPVKIMNYAFKHDYPELLNLVAPHLLNMPLDNAVKAIVLAHLAVFWVLY